MNTVPHSDSAVLTPFALKQLQLPNRMVVAPMTRISATHTGLATHDMCRYYTRFARGGFGLIITEGIYTDQAYAQGYANQPGLSDLEQAQAWRPVVDAVHAAGGRIVAQLMHAGAISQGNRFRHGTVGPSAIQPKGMQMPIYAGQGPYAMPRAMDETEIHQAIQGFAQAAHWACTVAGFDGVEIHGANGYLLDQFLTDYTNHRADDWGGSLERRLRLIMEVTQAVRNAVGAQTVVGLRLSQAKVNDFEHRWVQGETEAAFIFAQLAHAGLDYRHTTEFEAWRPAFTTGEANLIQLARRQLHTLPLIANGNLHTPCRAAQALSDGANLVALGRGALASPDWPHKLAAGTALTSFDAAVLSPLGNIKPQETC